MTHGARGPAAYKVLKTRKVHRGWHSRSEPCIFQIPSRDVDQSTALSPLCYLAMLRMADIIQQQ